MHARVESRILLIRHAPVVIPRRLFGRSDVGADTSDNLSACFVRCLMPQPDAVVTSPAKRARATCARIWPDMDSHTDPNLWEQDFGDWEGCCTNNLPDIGNLSGQELVNFTPPGGESFCALCHRTWPALLQAASRERVAIVAHAGTVRAALALASGMPKALAAPVDHWSATCVIITHQGQGTAICKPEFINSTRPVGVDNVRIDPHAETLPLPALIAEADF